MSNHTVRGGESARIRERTAVGDPANLSKVARDTKGTNTPATGRIGRAPDSLESLPKSKTLESFVVGTGSRVAHAAILAAAEHPGRTYNPICVQGPPGIGKTHLLQGLAHHLASPSHLRVNYTTGESFTNRYIAATQSHKLQEFLDQLCDVDVLILDNLQFIAGKRRTQDAFLEIASTLVANDRQVVLSCDRKPTELEKLSSRLLALLRGGLEAPIHPPSLDTRIAVVTAMAREKGFELPEATATFLARHVTGSLRELDGALTSLINVAHVHGPLAIDTRGRVPVDDDRPGLTLTLDLARMALNDFLPSGSGGVPKAITPEVIIDAVVDFYKVPLKDVLSPIKVRTIVRARQVGMFLTRELTPLSLAQIGARFGGRDHTTVLYALRCVERVHSRDPEFLAELDLLRSYLGKRSQD